MTDQPPSLARFDAAVYAHRYEEATREMLLILQKLNNANGVLDGFDLGVPFTEGGERELYVHFATRFVAAYGALVTAPDLRLDSVSLEAMAILHRWTDIMFTMSGFQSSAYLLARLPRDEAGRLILNEKTVAQFLLFFSPSSNVTIDFGEVAQANGVVTLVALLGYLAARSCISENAVALRDRILEWLPERMADVTLGSMQLAFAAEGYMHCSYAFTRGKHRIKADLIAQLRKALLAAGATEASGPPPARSRPKIVVVCEHFHSQHSVYRTHSRAVRSLRKHFDVIGVGYGDRVDNIARELFDEFIAYSQGDLIPAVRQTADAILAHRPDIVFHLGVGMSNHAVALASLRLAPTQCVSYGHTATTMSPVIDYMILPDDFIDAEDLYSEKLVRLPPEAIPYAPPDPNEAPVPPRQKRAREGKIKVAVPASIMKINARVLQALAEAARRAETPIEFHFFPLGAIGFAFYHLDHEVRRILPQAVIYQQSNRTTYLERLGRCDFFVSPFPYGNMNSIIDAIHMGLPGVCLDGEEAHSHADGAFFSRLGLPPALVTRSVEDYTQAIVRLADDREWLAECQAIAESVDLDETMFKGDESLFAGHMLKLLAS
jgi:hypothetical protein